MTTGTERCPQCDDNNRCGHEWHGDTWEHQAATVIRGLRAELDAARARERHALVAGAEALRRIAAATPIGHEDVTKGPSTYTWLCYAASLLMAEAATTPATPLEQELITMRAREAKIREALRETPCHLDCADFPREKWCLRCAALAEGDPHA